MKTRREIRTEVNEQSSKENRIGNRNKSRKEQKGE